MSKQSSNFPTKESEHKPVGKKRIKKNSKKKFGIEYRPSHRVSFSWFFRSKEWITYRRYLTKEDRDKALKTLERKDSYFEYRIEK